MRYVSAPDRPFLVTGMAGMLDFGRYSHAEDKAEALRAVANLIARIPTNART